MPTCSSSKAQFKLAGLIVLFLSSFSFEEVFLACFAPNSLLRHDCDYIYMHSLIELHSKFGILI